MNNWVVWDHKEQYFAEVGTRYLQSLPEKRAKAFCTMLNILLSKKRRTNLSPENSLVRSQKPAERESGGRGSEAGEGPMINSAPPERIRLPPLDSPSVESHAVMNNPDHDTLIRAVEDARRILGEYIEPGPRDATRAVEHLLAVLDRNDVMHALDRIKRRRVIRLVE